MGARQQNPFMLICTAKTVQKNILRTETVKLNAYFLYISLHSGSQRQSIKSSSVLLPHLLCFLNRHLIHKQFVEFHCTIGWGFFYGAKRLCNLKSPFVLPRWPQGSSPESARGALWKCPSRPSETGGLI